jgi:hypothetical protein
MLGSMWIGDVKIDSNTVLDPEMIKSKIKMLLLGKVVSLKLLDIVVRFIN